MKRIFFGIVVLLLTISVGYCQESKHPFQLTIRSDKQAYEVGEDIIIEVVHKNKSNEDVWLEDFYPDIDRVGHRSNFRFTVYKDKASTQQQYIHYEQLAKIWFKVERRSMKPGEEIVFKATLNKWYDMSQPSRYSIGCMKTHQFPSVKLEEEQLPIGQKEMYQFKAVTFVSNTLTIEVVETKTNKPETFIMDLKFNHKEGGTHWWTFTINENEFTTLSELKEFLKGLPARSILEFAPGCVRRGDEPLINSESEMQAFKKFCEDNGIDFKLIPSG